MSQNIKDIITNLKQIHMTGSTLEILLDFERVLDEMSLYAFSNWKQGELVQGPIVSKYRVECTFMWPQDKMPEPQGGVRLIDYGCKVEIGESVVTKVRKIKTPDDIRPGTRKGKLDHEPIWLVKITMPKKLMNDITRGYTELDRNKVEDLLTMNGGVNAHVDPAEQQVQDMANAEQPAAIPAA